METIVTTEEDLNELKNVADNNEVDMNTADEKMLLLIVSEDVADNNEVEVNTEDEKMSQLIAPEDVVNNNEVDMNVADEKMPQFIMPEDVSGNNEIDMNIEDQKLPQFIVPEDVPDDDEESSSEAETKFHTDDSDEIQPEPDITELLLLSEERRKDISALDDDDQRESNFVVSEDAPIETQQNKAQSPCNDEVLQSDTLKDGARSKQPSNKDKENKFTESIENEDNHQVDQLSSVEKLEKLPLKTEPEERQPSPEQLKTISNVNNLSSPNFKEHAQETLRRDISSQTLLVRGETDFYKHTKVNPFETEDTNAVDPDSTEIHRSISVQTVNAPLLLDVPSRSRRGSLISSSKAKIPKVLYLCRQMILEEETTESRRRMKKKMTSPIRKDEAGEIKTQDSSTKTSPERHNPSAVFYQANSSEKTVKVTKKEKENKMQNRSALFYTTTTMPQQEKSCRKPKPIITRSESLEISKKQNSGIKPTRRSSIRDRSLESEKAIAIANSAFRKLNANGELTVFNSSIPGMSSQQNASSFHFDNSQKLSCQRRGRISEFGKARFFVGALRIWKQPHSHAQTETHFHQPKEKRENTTATNTTSEKNDKKSVSSGMPNKIGIPKDITTKKEVPKRRKSIAGSTTSTIPALQVSSKVLSNKNTEKSIKAEGLKERRSYEITTKKRSQS
ncbi:ankyrin-2 [Caerostris extrusa]|uniref:Ankyrin-2 n=1 Tax=Caerostris extrusa TaxID=172846 RepID=A0AAV4MAM2_CAEEX|nr:ankyrin-2 [Caerostris extrusa]